MPNYPTGSSRTATYRLQILKDENIVWLAIREEQDFGHSLAQIQ